MNRLCVSVACIALLSGAGILERRKYCEHPARFEYHLTDAGRDLYPVIATLMHWGDKYVVDEGGPPVFLTHRGCGAPIEQHLRCADGHEVIRLVRRAPRAADEVRWDPRAADAGLLASGAAGSPALDGLGGCVHLAGAGRAPVVLARVYVLQMASRLP